LEAELTWLHAKIGQLDRASFGKSVWSMSAETKARMVDASRRYLSIVRQCALLLINRSGLSLFPVLIAAPQRCIFLGMVSDFTPEFASACKPHLSPFGRLA
jgi:hypothetical protein